MRIGGTPQVQQKPSVDESGLQKLGADKVGVGAEKAGNGIEGDRGQAGGAALPGGVDGGKLPTETLSPPVGEKAPVDTTPQMERAFDAAAADMARGQKAQKAMKGRRKGGGDEGEDEELDATGVPTAKATGLDETWDNWGKPVTGAAGGSALKGELDAEWMRARLRDP